MQVKLRGRYFKLHKISREGFPASLQLEMKSLAECKKQFLKLKVCGESAVTTPRGTRSRYSKEKGYTSAEEKPQGRAAASAS